ncbi:ATP-dependent DNA helicase 2 subunit KU70-like [Arachis ipaensis]|uniref:ATP-dependent DNA helicase 2 subunit KU70-like n=1 Tax=Arachis ipaensis TaxID=130454 RepID=UPI000A2B4597|nr:ATP-dependent DNA helicase 2 subunit KU70-like [Arachis ipaensis]
MVEFFQRHSEKVGMVTRASNDQIKKAADIIKRIDLKDFSICQFANPGLQRHYAVMQALALEEDEIPEIKDETLPDEEGLARPGVVKALEEFKTSVYGENYNEECEANAKPSEASKKRKVQAEVATKECENYDWVELADTGKVNLENFCLSFSRGKLIRDKHVCYNLKPVLHNKHTL